MGQGLVTVVVPVYNAEPHLRESLESILAQSHRPMDVIVMDDGSTDGSSETIATFGDRVRHVRNRTNLGQFPNVNRGLDLADGEFVAVFHSDDVYDRDIVAQAVEAFVRHPTAGAVFCKDRFVDTDGVEFGHLDLPPEFRGGGLFTYPQVLDGLLRHQNHFLRTPGAVVRRTVYAEVGPYRTDLGTAADFEMWLRISRHHPIAIVDRHLYSYRQRAESEGASYQRGRLAPDVFFDIVREYLEAEDGPEPATDARRAFRAHEAQDRVLTAARAYAAGEHEVARDCLAPVRLADLLSSRHVRRTRMTAVFLAVRSLCGLPPLEVAARLIRRRWGAAS